MGPVLVTDRLELRPVCDAEVAELHGVFSDPDVRRYLCDGQDFGAPWVRETVGKSLALFARRGLGLWAVRAPGAPEIVGVVGYAEFRDPPVLELLYALLPSQWGRGLATEAVRVLIDHGYSTGLEEIEASIDAPNRASARVLGRLGFREHHRVPADPPNTIWEQVHFVLGRSVS